MNSPKFFFSTLGVVATSLFLVLPLFASATIVTLSLGGNSVTYDTVTQQASGYYTGTFAPEQVATFIANTPGVSVTMSNTYADNTSAPVSFVTSNNVSQNTDSVNSVYYAVNTAKSANDILRAALDRNPEVRGVTQNSDGTLNATLNVGVGGVSITVVVNGVAAPNAPVVPPRPVEVSYTITSTPIVQSSLPTSLGIADVWFLGEAQSFSGGNSTPKRTLPCPVGFTETILGVYNDHKGQGNTTGTCIRYRSSPNEPGVTKIALLIANHLGGVSDKEAASICTTYSSHPGRPGYNLRPHRLGPSENFGRGVITCIEYGLTEVLGKVVASWGDQSCPADATIAFAWSEITDRHKKVAQFKTCAAYAPPSPPVISCPVISRPIQVSCDVDGQATQLPLPPPSCGNAQYSINNPATDDGSVITLDASLGTIHRVGGRCELPVRSTVRFKVTEDSANGPYVNLAQIYVNGKAVAGRLTGGDYGGYNLEISDNNIVGNYLVKFKKDGFNESDEKPIQVNRDDNGPFDFVLKRSQVCNNSAREGTEVCDDGSANGICPARCSTSCTWNNCVVRPLTCNNNGVPEGTEVCDDGSANGICPARCSTSCTVNTCVVRPPIPGAPGAPAPGAPPPGAPAPGAPGSPGAPPAPGAPAPGAPAPGETTGGTIPGSPPEAPGQPPGAPGAGPSGPPPIRSWKEIPIPRSSELKLEFCVACAPPPAGCIYVGGSCKTCGTVSCSNTPSAE